MVAILAVAVVIRVAALLAASQLPSFDHHRLDTLLYHQAGQAIASGRGLGDGVLHMSPLYQVFVGAVYWWLGDGPWALRWIQLAFGVATVASLFAAGHVLWGRREAIASGIVAALYGPFVFYEQQLMVASLGALLISLLVLVVALVYRRDDRRLRWWAIIGALWGLSVLARPTALLFALPLALAAWQLVRELRPALVRFGLAAGLAAVVVLPATLHNLVVGGELVLVTDSGGLNFYLGNGPGANGTFRVPPEMPGATNAQVQFRLFREAAERELGHPLSSKEVDAFWFGAAFDEIRARPGVWLRLLLEKAWLFWNARELPNTMDYGFHRTLNPVLGLPLIQLGMLLPLAWLGLGAMVWRRRPPELCIVLLFAVQMASLVAFFVLAHYRIPAVPLFMLCAVAGGRLIVDAIRQSRVRAILGAAVVVAVGAAIAYASKLPKPYDDEYFKLGYAYHLRGSLRDAEAAYLDALAINRRNISAHKNLASLYETIGDRAGAQVHWTEVLRLAEATGDRERAAVARHHLDALAPPTRPAPP